ncbi:histone H1.5-like [Haliotis asinina]|uniref:histone H1.5-like n=1 Tax=Haliotis asinina TaxID=109174 RepID=UPI0035318227
MSEEDFKKYTLAQDEKAIDFADINPDENAGKTQVSTGATKTLEMFKASGGKVASGLVVGAGAIMALIAQLPSMRKYAGGLKLVVSQFNEIMKIAKLSPQAADENKELIARELKERVEFVDTFGKVRDDSRVYRAIQKNIEGFADIDAKRPSKNTGPKPLTKVAKESLLAEELKEEVAIEEDVKVKPEDKKPSVEEVAAKQIKEENDKAEAPKETPEVKVEAKPATATEVKVEAKPAEAKPVGVKPVGIKPVAVKAQAAKPAKKQRKFLGRKGGK